MKNLYKTILIFFTLFCNEFSYCQKVSIEIFNKTGFKIDSLYFADRDLGPLNMDSSTNTGNLELIVFSSAEVPLETPYAAIFGVKVEKPLKKCGTKSSKRTCCSYQFDLHSYPSENGFRLYWLKHE
ncbi:MAG: hypothetical protein ACK46O_12735 [Flavobacteriia bacterium]|jgi:hypothetical protein